MLASFVMAIRPRDWTPLSDQARAIAVDLLKAQGVSPKRHLVKQVSEQQKVGRVHFRFQEERFRVPSGFRWDSFRSDLERRIQADRLTLLKTQRESGEGSWIFQAQIGKGRIPLYRLILETPKPTAAAPSMASPIFPKGKGKIAIVLDDWGYNLRQVPFFQEIRRPLTVAVLPNLPFSNQVAQSAHSKGHEVILHLPMESVDPNAPREPGTLSGGMSRQEILSALDRSLATVPHVQGISNHQGSKATAVRPFMETVLEEAKRRKLYFLDSLTGPSVGEEVARAMKVRFAERAVFLDNELEPTQIRQRLVELAKAAAAHGEAIGIGHDRPATLQVLREAIPDLEKAGYQIVPVSQLAKEKR